jgi:hypothetical protein
MQMRLVLRALALTSLCLMGASVARADAVSIGTHTHSQLADSCSKAGGTYSNESNGSAICWKGDNFAECNRHDQCVGGSTHTPPLRVSAANGFGLGKGLPAVTTPQSLTAIAGGSSGGGDRGGAVTNAGKGNVIGVR